jgi:hypothetical protein
MNNAADYFAAAIPEPFQILNLRLLPFSLGRYRLLRRLECAFVAEEETNATISDFIIGVLACSMPVKEFLAFANSKQFHKEVRRWSRKVTPLPWLCAFPFIGKYWRNKFSFNLLEKINLFKRYLTEGSQMPEYWVKEDDNSVGGIHWAQSLDMALRSQLGWTDAEIEEEPLGEAFMAVLALGEANGRIQLISLEEKEAGIKNAELLAQMELN